MHLKACQDRCDSHGVTPGKGANLRVSFATRRQNRLTSTGSLALPRIGMKPGPLRREVHGRGDAENEAVPKSGPCSAREGASFIGPPVACRGLGPSPAGAAVEAASAPAPRGFKARVGRQGLAAPWDIAGLSHHAPPPSSGRPGWLRTQLPRRAADLAPPGPDKAEPQPGCRPDDSGMPRLRRRGRTLSCRGAGDAAAPETDDPGLAVTAA